MCRVCKQLPCIAQNDAFNQTGLVLSSCKYSLTVEHMVWKLRRSIGPSYHRLWRKPQRRGRRRMQSIRKQSKYLHEVTSKIISKNLLHCYTGLIFHGEKWVTYFNNLFCYYNLLKIECWTIPMRPKTGMVIWVFHMEYRWTQVTKGMLA